MAYVVLSESIAFDDIRMSLCKYDAKTLCTDFDVWAFNRNLKDEHVQKIYDDLCSQKFPHLMGSVKAVKDDNNNLQIIDGQHRLEALRMFINDYSDQHLHVFVEMYHVPSIHSDVVFDLFRIANNNLNVAVEDDVNMMIATLVNRLIEDPVLGKGIVDKNDGRVNRPRISKKALYEELKHNLKVEHMKLPINVLVDRVKKINTHISKLDYLQMFGRKETSQFNVNMRCNAEKYGFFLNMSGKFTPEKWISMIDAIEKVV
jgi:hypothetical protein